MRHAFDLREKEEEALVSRHHQEMETEEQARSPEQPPLLLDSLIDEVYVILVKSQARENAFVRAYKRENRSFLLARLPGALLEAAELRREQAREPVPRIYNTAWRLLHDELVKHLASQVNALREIGGIFDTVYQRDMRDYEAVLQQYGLSTWHQKAVVYFWCYYAYTTPPELMLLESGESGEEEAFERLDLVDSERNLLMLELYQPFMTLNQSEARHMLRRALEGARNTKHGHWCYYLLRLSTTYTATLTVSLCYRKGNKGLSGDTRYALRLDQDRLALRQFLARAESAEASGTVVTDIHPLVKDEALRWHRLRDTGVPSVGDAAIGYYAVSLPPLQFSASLGFQHHHEKDKAQCSETAGDIADRVAFLHLRYHITENFEEGELVTEDGCVYVYRIEGSDTPLEAKLRHARLIERHVPAAKVSQLRHMLTLLAHEQLEVEESREPTDVQELLLGYPVEDARPIILYGVGKFNYRLQNETIAARIRAYYTKFVK